MDNNSPFGQMGDEIKKKRVREENGKEKKIKKTKVR